MLDGFPWTALLWIVASNANAFWAFMQSEEVGGGAVAAAGRVAPVGAALASLTLAGLVVARMGWEYAVAFAFVPNAGPSFFAALVFATLAGSGRARMVLALVACGFCAGNAFFALP